MIQGLQLRAVEPHQQELFICSLPALWNMTGAHPHQSALFEDTGANMMEHGAFFSPPVFSFLWGKEVLFLFRVGGNQRDISEQMIFFFSAEKNKKQIKLIKYFHENANHVSWMWMWLFPSWPRRPHVSRPDCEWRLNNVKRSNSNFSFPVGLLWLSFAAQLDNFATIKKKNTDLLCIIKMF